MQSFVIRQNILGLEAHYEVYREGEEDVYMTMVGTEAIMRLYEGEIPELDDSEEPDLDETEAVASFRMRSILSETKFEVFDDTQQSIAFFDFPIIEFRKRFHLMIGDQKYEGEGGIRGRTFKFRDSAKEIVIEIAKHSSFRDKYTLKVFNPLPLNVGLLAVAVIDQV